MNKPFYSNHWYRIAALKPRLKTEVRIQRQLYRGTPWYVLEHPVSHRFYRFSAGAYALVEAMDGRRTVQEIWEEARATRPAESPTQDELLQLLAQLHSADALECQVAADLSAMLLNRDRANRGRWRSQLLNPLSSHFSLFDPDCVLDRFFPIVGSVFSRAGTAV